jgi:hypothetical protein
VGPDDDAPRGGVDKGAVALLGQEIQELERLIQLQTRKLDALRVLRDAFLGTEGSTAPAARLLPADWEAPLRMPEREAADGASHEDYLFKKGVVDVDESPTVVDILTFQMVREGESSLG